MRKIKWQAVSLLVVMGLFIQGCSLEKSEIKLFEEIPSTQSTIQFINTVKQSGENNVLNYPYYFNGGGVAVGDINNDGLPDVYFTGNQVPNKLYLNKGNFKFEDITASAGVAAPLGWKTGVTMADVNQDGWLDIYVCRSAMGDSVLRENLLFINNGNATFTEKARDFGLADNSYSTQASFFDYDQDGDLDLFVLNHSLPQYGGFSKLLGDLKNRKSTKFGSKLYQNNKGKFTDVSEKAGIVNNVLSFGLGLAISDLNQDGWPDLYISNDFNEEDYLYINNQDGTFKNVIRDATGHVSLFSMGSDIADINNDAMPDIFTLDMMPETNERIKLSSGDDNYDKYQILINAGFHHQSMRNMLQLNNGNGTFSEIGQLAGISNTDWSWSALFADFDGDGFKDLYVGNGYEKDYTNMQFLKFTVDEQIKARQTGTSPDLHLILDKMPAIEVGNYLFKNNGNLTFDKKSAEWGLSRKFKSNGAAYADLDNDGDLDLLINAMNEVAVVYQNKNVERDKKNYLKVDVVKENPRQVVMGTKILTYHAGAMQYHEFSPVRGFQSCMHVPLSIGMNDVQKIDSVRIIWPDGKTQLLKNVSTHSVLTPKYEEATDRYQYRAPSQASLFKTESLLKWKQIQTDANDFKRQFLLPKMLSFTGPKIITGDVNKDGLQDVFICAPKHQAASLFIQQKNGSLKLKNIPAFDADKDCQDEDASFFDADGDGDLDLYVVSGGYPFDEQDPLLQDRLYRNNGNGDFTKDKNSIPAEFNAGSCVTVLDADNDLDLDLFVGSRLIPGKYPLTPQSMFLINNGKGFFTNDVKNIAPSLQNIGMVCDAKVADLNNDSFPDLIVAGDWMSVKIFINRQGKLIDQTSTWVTDSTSGWWNCIATEDFDHDGDLDFVAGNYGQNNQFNVSPAHPASLIFKDFNNDSQVDPFFCYYVGDRSYPYASRDEALGQVSFLKQRFPDYVTYANATIDTIFKTEEMKNINLLNAAVLKTAYFENKGDKFEMHDLPVQAQFSPIYSIVAWDVDNDGDKDVVMAGNDTQVRVRIGKSDANAGVVLLNNGKGEFSYLQQYKSGLNLRGDVRSQTIFKNAKGVYLLIGIMGKEIESYKLNTRTP